MLVRFMRSVVIRKMSKLKQPNHPIQEIFTVKTREFLTRLAGILRRIGVTKCFGEALCRYMGEKEGLSSIAVRIGAFQPHDAAQNQDSINMMDAWISERDCLQLLERCIDAPEDLKFAVVHGLSANTFNRMEIDSTRKLLGYEPQDNFFDESAAFKKLNMSEELVGHNVEYVDSVKKCILKMIF